MKCGTHLKKIQILKCIIYEKILLKKKTKKHLKIILSSYFRSLKYYTNKMQHLFSAFKL